MLYIYVKCQFKPISKIMFFLSSSQNIMQKSLGFRNASLKTKTKVKKTSWSDKKSLILKSKNKNLVHDFTLCSNEFQCSVPP